MPATLRKIDLLRAALHAQGASPMEIEEHTLLLQKHPRFARWNTRLTKQALGWLARFDQPGGRAFAADILAGLAQFFADAAGMTPEDLAEAAENLRRERRGNLS